MLTKSDVHIPAISNIDIALEIYYKQQELSNKHINAIFGKRSSATVNKLKQLAKAEMIEQGVCSYSAYTVNTSIAYRVWGINIEDLEQRRAKLKKLGL